MRITTEQPGREDVRQLLTEHLQDMHSTSPAESVHALDLSGLNGAGMTFWTAREEQQLLGCGALRELSAQSAEIKSMRTHPAARNRGIAGALLSELIAESRRRGYQQLYLETGSQEFFAPARRLYRRHGFNPTGPFADYRLDPHSVFMVLALGETTKTAPDQAPAG